MILFAVIVWHEAEFDDTPFFAIYKFALILLIDVGWNLAFIGLDAKVGDREAAKTMHQVDDDGEASEKLNFFTSSKTVFDGCGLLWYNLIKKGSECTTVHNSVRTDVSLQ